MTRNESGQLGVETMSGWHDFFRALRLCLAIWLIAAAIFVLQAMLVRVFPSAGDHVPSRPYVSVFVAPSDISLTHSEKPLQHLFLSLCQYFYQAGP